MLNTVPSTLATKLARYCSSSARFRDRKSTRLNSSHLVISYAVFCLKKKKNTTHLTTPILRPIPQVALAFRGHSLHPKTSARQRYARVIRGLNSLVDHPSSITHQNTP